MRCVTHEDGQGRLLCTVKCPAGTIIGALVIGGFFCLVGLVLLFSSLPHTELLVVERDGGGFTFYRAQLLGGQWPLYEYTVRSPGPCSARVQEDVDEGSSTYMVMVDTPEGTVPYGKLKAERVEVERQVEQLESFFRFAFETRTELREDFWWWYLAFIGLFGLGMGLGVIGLMAVTDRWTFDRTRGTVTHQRVVFLPITVRRWPWSDVAGVRHTTADDADGDTFHRLTLLLRTGGEVRMNTVSSAMRNAEHLDEVASRIRSYLGVS